jgi:hypothetical protein
MGALGAGMEPSLGTTFRFPVVLSRIRDLTRTVIESAES